MFSIFTGGSASGLLSEEALDRADIKARIERAEMRVVGRYREKSALRDSPLFFDEPIGAETSPGIVQLRGWAETDSGKPDIEAMPDGLVKRLRVVVAQVVEWSIKREDTEEVASESVGSKSVSFKDLDDMPTRLFQPLDKYDTRAPLGGFW